MTQMLPVVAILGRPNVGKSTLFNQLTATRDALVIDQPGMTRDRRFGTARADFGAWLVVDTGGLRGLDAAEPATAGPDLAAHAGQAIDEAFLDRLVDAQSLKAARESDVVLLVVDVRDGLAPMDETIAGHLRRLGKPVLLVANKVDGADPDIATAEFHACGLGMPAAVAAKTGRGIRALAARIVELLPKPELPEEAVAAESEGHKTDALSDDTPHGGEPNAVADGMHADVMEGVDDNLDEDSEDDAEEALEPSIPENIRIAIIGRPNVGKSTLTNRLLGEPRVIVSPLAGTTRDSIEQQFERMGRQYTFIDTAGIRRRARVDETAEKFSVVDAIKAMNAAHIALVVIDAQEGMTEQDAAILGLAVDSGRSIILAVNKWDGLSTDERDFARSGIERRTAFCDYAEVRFISALHGSGTGKLFQAFEEAHRAAYLSPGTAEVTRLLEAALESHPPPLVSGRRIKLRYAHIGGHNPPRIVIHGNQTERIPKSYQRYLANFFRTRLKMTATPIAIEFRTGDNPFKGRHNKLTPRQARKRQRMLRHVKKR